MSELHLSAYFSILFSSTRQQIIKACNVCISHQEFQQSVGPIDTVNHFIHVLHWSLPELLHHEENIDEQSAEDLKQAEKDVLLGVMLLMGGRLARMSSSPILCYLQ